MIINEPAPLVADTPSSGWHHQTKNVGAAQHNLALTASAGPNSVCNLFLSEFFDQHSPLWSLLLSAVNGEWCDTPQKENPAPVKGNISGCWIQDWDFQSLCIHPFCVVGKTPGGQLWKHPGAGSEVTARSQRCHRRPVAFITSFLSGKSCFFKWSSSQALLCPSASRWARCYWAIPQDDYSIAGINPQEEEGNSVASLHP